MRLPLAAPRTAATRTLAGAASRASSGSWAIRASRATRMARAALAALPLLAACQSAPTGEHLAVTDYAAALGPWRGLTEQVLVARWGAPQSVEDNRNGRWLVFWQPLEPGARPPVIPIVDPLSAGCVTRFLVEDGVLTRWTVDGTVCRRPLMPD